MSRYVPTTDAVKTNYAASMYAHNKGREIDPYRFFDSWLIAHDAELREQIAREIEARKPRASKLSEYVTGVRRGIYLAARIARGETGEVKRCLQCGCDLQYPTAVHIVDCGTRKEQD